jgi:hypothetical protein
MFVNFGKVMARSKCWQKESKAQLQSKVKRTSIFGTPTKDLFVLWAFQNYGASLRATIVQ